MKFSRTSIFGVSEELMQMIAGAADLEALRPALGRFADSRKVPVSHVALNPVGGALIPDEAFGLPVLVAQALEGAAAQAPAKTPSRKSGTVAVIPFFGFVEQRGGLWGEFFGSAPLDLFQARLAMAAGDADVKGIVVEFDSPGGEVYGVTEAAALIRAVRNSKPVVGFVNAMAASSAYWIASACDEVIATPSGDLGAIGVFMIHDDVSGYLDKLGVKATIISAGKYKTEASPFGPLGDDAKAAIQSRVDGTYSAFVADVAKGRRTTPDTVRGGFGEGRAVRAKDAVSQGMADTVGSMGDAVRRSAALSNVKAAAAASRAQATADLRKLQAGS